MSENLGTLPYLFYFLAVPKSISFMVGLDGESVDNKLLGRPPPRLKVKHVILHNLKIKGMLT